MLRILILHHGTSTINLSILMEMDHTASKSSTSGQNRRLLKFKPSKFRSELSIRYCSSVQLLPAMLPEVKLLQQGDLQGVAGTFTQSVCVSDYPCLVSIGNQGLALESCRCVGDLGGSPGAG